MPLLCTSRIDTNDVLIQSHRHADTAIATYRHRRKKSLQVLFLLTLGMPLGAVPPHLGHALVFLFLSLCGGSLFCEIPCYYVIKLFKNMKQYFMMIGMEILFTFLLFSSFFPCSAAVHLAIVFFIPPNLTSHCRCRWSTRTVENCKDEAAHPYHASPSCYLFALYFYLRILHHLKWCCRKLLTWSHYVLHLTESLHPA